MPKSALLGVTFEYGLNRSHELKSRGALESSWRCAGMTSRAAEEEKPAIP